MRTKHTSKQNKEKLKEIREKIYILKSQAYKLEKKIIEVEGETTKHKNPDFKKSKSISISLTELEIKKLKTICESKDITVRKLLKQLLRNFLLGL
jgi:3-phenylpropionate/cinnamic acid dioxygenase small subunit